MRHNRLHAETDPAVVRRLIAENPWSTLVGHAGGKLVASHDPVLDETRRRCFSPSLAPRAGDARVTTLTAAA